jgi:DNA-directed RNA polymerase specialized sigma24 family protein
MVASVPDCGEPLDRHVARVQLRNVLERQVSELPEIFRVVFVLRSVEELSFEEIAAILSVPVETARSRHFRAKGLLRESLAKEINLAESDIFEFAGARCASIVAAVLASLSRTEGATEPG